MTESTMASSSSALEQLEAAVTSAQALCQQLAASLDRISKNPSSSASNNHTTTTGIIPAPLDLARDASTLVRAHATKLSLLIINEPFTASAVLDVLKELLHAGPVLGVASAVEACDPAQYTAFFRKELAWRSKRVLVTLADLLGKIPKDGGGAVLSGAEQPGLGTRDNDKGSLPATGMLWSACDDVLALVSGGVGGYLVKRVDEWKDTLKDVMEELKEWGDQEPDDDDDDDDDDNDNVAHESSAINTENNATSTQAMLDDLMSSGQAIPRDDPRGIRPRLDSTLRRVRLVVLLYQAISKRRLKKLPPFPLPAADTAYQQALPERLDEAARVLSGLPDSFGDLASAFYDMEPAAIDQAVDECFFAAFAAAEMLSPAWDGKQDEFSEWTEKFKIEIKKS